MVQGLLKKSKGKKPHAARKNGTPQRLTLPAPKNQKATSFSAKRNKVLTKVSKAKEDGYLYHILEIWGSDSIPFFHTRTFKTTAEASTESEAQCRTEI